MKNNSFVSTTKARWKQWQGFCARICLRYSCSEKGIRLSLSPQSQRGMTLLEVLVAVALFAMVAVGVSGTMATYSSAPLTIEKKQTAGLVADAVMVQKSLGLLEENTGKMTQGRHTYFYDVTVKPSSIDRFDLVTVTIMDTEKKPLGTLSKIVTAGDIK